MTRNPPEIYAIGLVDGRATVKVAENKDYIDDVIWETIEILGEAIECAIEFDGDWTKIVGQYRFETEEKPWAFWIDNNNILWGQHLLDNSTKIELSNEVVKLTAVKGYRNIIFTDMDQGLVVMYIKEDGLVYYRSRIFASEGIYVWDNEILVTEFTKIATAIRSFRTNDYRIGFIIEDTDGISTMLLTDRSWAGIAIGSERIIAYPYEIKLDLFDLDYVEGYEEINLKANPYSIDFDLRYADTDNEFMEIYNEPITLINESEEEYQDWGKVLIFKTQNKLYNLNKSDFEIVDSSNKPYNPDTIEEIDGFNYVYKLNFIDTNNFNNVNLIGTLKFKGLITTNGVDVPYDTFEKVFHPLNLVPTEVPIPVVMEVWNE
jgi:hypothetical protein